MCADTVMFSIHIFEENKHFFLNGEKGTHGQKQPVYKEQKKKKHLTFSSYVFSNFANAREEENELAVGFLFRKTHGGN